MWEQLAKLEDIKSAFPIVLRFPIICMASFHVVLIMTHLRILNIGIIPGLAIRTDHCAFHVAANLRSNPTSK